MGRDALKSEFRAGALSLEQNAEQRQLGTSDSSFVPLHSDGAAPAAPLAPPLPYARTRARAHALASLTASSGGFLGPGVRLNEFKLGDGFGEFNRARV